MKPVFYIRTHLSQCTVALRSLRQLACTRPASHRPRLTERRRAGWGEDKSVRSPVPFDKLRQTTIQKTPLPPSRAVEQALGGEKAQDHPLRPDIGTVPLLIWISPALGAPTSLLLRQ